MPKKSQNSLNMTIKSRIKPVAKISVSDEIVDQILALLAKGDLKPGQRLPSERELCKNFGVGRSSLREALRCLSMVGVLTARVGEGTSVAIHGGKFLGKIVEWRIITEKSDIEDLMEVRVGLEGVTAASAARCASGEDIATLQLLLTKMEAAVEDEKLFAALDLQFHVSVAAASHNRLIVDLVSMIRNQLAKTLSKVLSVPKALPLSLKDHATIVNAISRRDPEAAQLAMHRHLNNTLERYKKGLGNDHIVKAQSRLHDIPSSPRGTTKIRAMAKTSS